MKIKRIIRALFTALPTIGSPLEQMIFGSYDDKEIERIKENISKGDKALGVERDKEGNVINNPFDFGEI